MRHLHMNTTACLATWLAGVAQVPGARQRGGGGGLQRRRPPGSHVRRTEVREGGRRARGRGGEGALSPGARREGGGRERGRGRIGGERRATEAVGGGREAACKCLSPARPPAHRCLQPPVSLPPPPPPPKHSTHTHALSPADRPAVPPSMCITITVPLIIMAPPPGPSGTASCLCWTRPRARLWASTPWSSRPRCVPCVVLSVLSFPSVQLLDRQPAPVGASATQCHAAPASRLPAGSPHWPSFPRVHGGRGMVLAVSLTPPSLWPPPIAPSATCPAQRAQATTARAPTHPPFLALLPSCPPCLRTQRVTAVAWSPVLQGRAYSFATAAGEDITLWSIDPYSGGLAAQKVRGGIGGGGTLRGPATGREASRPALATNTPKQSSVAWACRGQPPPPNHFLLLEGVAFAR